MKECPQRQETFSMCRKTSSKLIALSGLKSIRDTKTETFIRWVCVFFVSFFPSMLPSAHGCNSLMIQYSIQRVATHSCHTD